MASLIRRVAFSTSSQWEDGDWDNDSWVLEGWGGQDSWQALKRRGQRVRGKCSLAALVPGRASVEVRECNLTTGEGRREGIWVAVTGKGMHSQK